MLLLHTDSPLTTPRVEFSNDVTFREIDYDLSDTISGESSTPSSFQFSISFSDSCSSKLSSYLESPRSVNDDITNKSTHSGSMSSTCSTISYRSYQSCDTVNSDISTNDSSTMLHSEQNGTSSDSTKSNEDTQKSNIWRASRKCSQLNLQCLISPHRKASSLFENEKENGEISPRSESLNKPLSQSLDSLIIKEKELHMSG